MHKRHFTANPTVRERAEKLIRRKLLAKGKLSAGDLASMIRDRLDDFSCKLLSIALSAGPAAGMQ